jgi:hypothetical protein
MIPFHDTQFIIARRLLCEPDKHWTTLDFPDCHRPSVVGFLKELIKSGIASRPRARGRSSHTTLTHPNALLELCIRQFNRNEEKSLSFFSQRKTEELLGSLTSAKREFYLGRFSGIRKNLVHATESSLSLLIPDRKTFYGDGLADFQMEFRLLKVKFGGNVTVILPRYKLFLKKTAITQYGLKLPDDFYTYLYLATATHIMATPQREYIEKKLRGINGSFLSWR